MDRSYMQASMAGATTRQTEMDDRANDLIDSALKDYDAFQRTEERDKRWKLLRSLSENNVYGEREHLSQSSHRTMLLYGFVPGTIAQFLAGVYTDDKDSLETARHFLTPGVVDAELLHVFESHHLNAPTVLACIKRAILPCFANIKESETIYYEKLGWREDDHGHRFGYQLMFSIDAPDLVDPKQTKRSKTYTCCVNLLKQFSPDWISVFTITEVDFGNVGNVIGTIIEQLTANRTTEAYNAVLMARSKAYLALINANTNQPIKQKGHDNDCKVCREPERFLSKLRPCAGCGHFACSKCRHKRMIFRLRPKSNKYDKALFCLECIDAVQNKRFHMDHDISDLAAASVSARAHTSSDSSAYEGVSTESDVALSSSSFSWGRASSLSISQLTKDDIVLEDLPVLSRKNTSEISSVTPSNSWDQVEMEPNEESWRSSGQTQLTADPDYRSSVCGTIRLHELD